MNTNHGPENASGLPSDVAAGHGEAGSDLAAGHGEAGSDLAAGQGEAASGLRAELAAEFGELLRRCEFSDSLRCLDCAVSGGADSVALATLGFAAGYGLRLHHVDHGLRPGSASEADVVAKLAGTLGADFIAHRVDIGDGANLEERAREQRYATLPQRIATGHTMDDQAETMLINLLRGAGSSGLSPLRNSETNLRMRPLIGLRRKDTERVAAFIAEVAGVEIVQDEMNHDSRFLRVRVRQELVGLMCDLAGRDVVPVLARQAQYFGSDNDFLDDLASSIDATDAKAVAAAPQALAQRALREFIFSNWDRQYQPTSGAVQRALEVARNEALSADLEGGYRIQRTHQRLRITRDAT